MLARLYSQVSNYGGTVIPGKVVAIEHDNGVFVATLDTGRHIRSKTVIISTGATDVAPPFPSMERLVKKGLLRYCPICDGFEAIGKTVGVLGRGVHGAKETLFISDYARVLTLICDIPLDENSKEALELRSRHVEVVIAEIDSIRESDVSGLNLVLRGGEIRQFDVLYSALGLHTKSELAKQLGADCDETGQVLVDEHMQTNIAGLYASGDVATGLNQISVATGQSAIAATAIHNYLRARL